MLAMLNNLTRWRKIVLGAIALWLLFAGVQNVRAYMAYRDGELFRVLDAHRYTLVAPAARLALDEPRAVPAWPIVGAASQPALADQFPMVAYPVAAAVMLGLCFLRLGKRNRWAYTALGGAAAGMSLTMLTWAHYGYPVGAWIEPAADLMRWLLARPVVNSLLALVAVLGAAALLFPPFSRPKPAHQPKRSRPDSPNDPRLALEYLGAQRNEGECSTLEYARRREAILARI